MPVDNEGSGDEAGKAGASNPPVDPIASPEDAHRPNADTLDGIVSEGERERLALSRRTGRAVFRNPASVTPRVLALLGEIGVAEFVEQIRADAEFLILRAKNQPEGSAEAGSPPAETATRPPPVNPRARYRRPAPFGRPAAPAKPSLAGRVAGCAPLVLRTFVVEVAVYSSIALVALVVSIAGVRLLAFSLK